eukprot:RCo046455
MLILPELFGDSLDFLDFKDLLICESVSKVVQRLILHRKLWRNQFENFVRKENWCWPRVDAEHTNWKEQLFTYYLETKVRRSLIRNVLSAKFVWRCTELWDRLPEAFKIHQSPVFEVAKLNGVPVGWTILLQRLQRDGRDCLGIFLQQKVHPVRCFFSLCVLDDAGAVVQRHACTRHFPGNGTLEHSTCGWVFPLNTLFPVVDYERGDIRIELDLTVFPDELEAVQPLLELVKSVKTPDDLKRATISALGDFVTHTAADPKKAKQHLQEVNGGPLPLVELLESPSSNTQLRCSAAGALWNMLDTSEIRVTDDLIERMVTAACCSMHCLFFRRRRPVSEEVAMVDASSSSDECSTYDALCNDPDLESENGLFLRDHLTNALTGLMWNIPIEEKYRKMMAAQPHFFPCIFHILENKDYSRTHFSCLHLLTTLHHYGHLPAPLVPRLHSNLTQYLEEKGAAAELSAGEVGVLLSLRDVADFFITLLLSKKIDCVTFGAWCMDVFYFKTVRPG